jgi:AGZA family xanthine/uracil permease-like MFS transporter
VSGRRGPSWLAVGDLNAFFALLLDNVVNLVVLTAILSFQFGMPAAFILTRMVPGTALGVLVGDLAYSWMAARRGRSMTAMPLGLDTPSTLGMALIVIGPVFAQSGDPYVAWEVGMATLVLMGVVKVFLAFFGDAVERWIPRAGLLGPLAGIGLALLGLFPVVRILSAPVAGMMATGIVLYALVAGHRLPWRLPGALVAVVVGIVLYHLLGALGWQVVPAHGAGVAIGWHPALPEFGRVVAGLPGALDFLPVSIPFGLLTIIGGINVTASARAAGDTYRTRDILLVEAGATLLAGLFGGVAQSTPYIGHPAYKAMGAKAGYTLATGLVVGLGGMLGLLGAVIDIVPEVAVAPILLFVGIAVTAQAFQATPPRHLPAVAFSILPVLAYVVTIYTGQLTAAGAVPPPSLAAELEALTLLGRGFILTAMLWGAAAAFLIDRRTWAVLASFTALAVLSVFGVIHSIDPVGGVYLPGAFGDARPWTFAAAYLATGLVLAALCATGRPPPENGHSPTPGQSDPDLPGPSG